MTPSEVANWYSLLASAGGVYSHPQTSKDGLPVLTGGQTRTVFGVPTRVSFRADVLAHLRHPMAAQVLGHEGAHMVNQSDRLGLTRDEIRDIPWRYR